jgi:hypothetical protein
VRQIIHDSRHNFSAGFQDSRKQSENFSETGATTVRQEFVDFFSGPGAVGWQDSSVASHNY